MKIRSCFPLLLVLTVLGFQSHSSATVRIGILYQDNYNPHSELDSLAGVIDACNGFTAKLIPVDEAGDLSKFDILWYHRADTGAIRADELTLGERLLPYVKSGGRLILTMDAVRLLNSWAIEPTPVQSAHYNAVDEGFGRKAGFHAFREHPLFRQMFGGAYVWHGKQDNQCRLSGFFDNTQPVAPGSKVIACFWEYIYYRPEQKLVWETPVGEGRILSVGGCLYYGQPNFNRLLLQQFTNNMLDYMGPLKSKQKAFYWGDHRPDTVKISTETAIRNLRGGEEWKLSPTGDKLKWIAAGNASIDLAGRRQLLIAREKGGIEEIWTHPVMSLRDYDVKIEVAATGKEISLSQLSPEIELRPNAIIRTYTIPGNRLREIITTDIHEPLSVIHYEWEGKKIDRISVGFKSNLRFMWPYDESATGKLSYQWSDKLNAFLINDARNEFVSLVGSNQKGVIKNISPDTHSVKALMEFNVSDRHAFDIFLASGNEGLKNCILTYRKFLKRPIELFNSSELYYKEYLNSLVGIKTPDSLLNQGYRWALTSACQFLVNTPGIGYSLMAGYSSSARGWNGAQKISGRPGYAWYFGRDSEWSAMAFKNAGDFGTVRAVLENLIKYQQIDGKIYHELTTSGSVHYDASDATPLFVHLVSLYVKASGDIDFIKKHISSVHRAMDYCYSTDTDQDRLIEITNVGHGWLEGGNLYGSQTEFYLAGIWQRALEDAGYLAGLAGNGDKQQKYILDAAAVKKVINNGFWNEKGYYNYGKKSNGSYTDQLIALACVPAYLGVTDPGRSRKMLLEFSSPRFSTDWGVRMADKTDSSFDPGAYHSGSIWPLFTGWISLAEYRQKMYLQGYNHLLDNIQNYRLFSPGRMPEVINGLKYELSGVTPHQCWSETMITQALIEGLFGFIPDAIHNHVTLAPRLPADWNETEITNLRCGNNRLSMTMKKNAGRLLYQLETAKDLDLLFNPAFAPGTNIKSVTIDGRDTPFKIIQTETHTEVSILTKLKKQVLIEIKLIEGASVLAVRHLSNLGDTTSSFRIIDQELHGEELKVSLEALPGSSHSLRFYLPKGYLSTRGIDNMHKVTDSVYEANVAFDKSGTSYIKKTIYIKPDNSKSASY
ncbi:amylo-alpha-1,6-glucosidase [Arcticibacter tournemirensis]|uniref:Mannosylglycerate hydrolase MGH1-like glycoside hydrolase domain-containing protein n=2 Tax=Pseudomonadati TaxID=3379134 RepID=A0A4Q0MA67_9SPHI|nr:GH116 family glycosyl hydrolase [Arcticibacter tournemirensis]RXF70138.1 hypothetical protein EKH83_09660 [Arcticibacter tournemirensis]